MAWTFTARGSSGGYASNPSIGDTFTPTEGNFIVLVFEGAITGISGWSISFSQVNTALSYGSNDMYVYAGEVGASPGSDQLSVTTSGSGNYLGAVLEIAGGDDTVTVANYFVQEINESSYNGGSANPIASGFAAFASATNATLVIQGGGDSSQTFATQSGMTNLMAASGGSTAFRIDYKTSEESNPEYSPVSGFLTDGARAFELKEAGGGGATGKSNPLNGPLGGPLAGPIGM